MTLRRTNDERDLLRRAREVLPGGSLGNVYPDGDDQFLITRGKGSHVWDVSRNEYVDYLLGSGPMFLGHAHPAVTKAVHEAIDDGSTFFATNDRAVRLAEEVHKAVPCADKVRFTT